MISNCSTCSSRGGIFKVSNGRICFICLDILKKKLSYTHEELYELDIETIRKAFLANKSTEKVLYETNK